MLYSDIIEDIKLSERNVKVKGIKLPRRKKTNYPILTHSKEVMQTPDKIRSGMLNINRSIALVITK